MDDKNKELFDELVRNTLLYGTGMYILQTTQGGGFKGRVVPFSEYAELGEALINFPERKDING